MTTFLTNPNRGCAKLPTDLFYPSPGDPANRARAACASCPVRRDCTRHALAQGERHGLWGGYLMSSTEEVKAARAGQPPKQVTTPRRTVDAVRDLWRHGLSDTQIAARIGVTRCTVRDHRHNLGLPAHYRGGTRIEVAA